MSSLPKGKKAYKSWNKDGVNDGPSSLDIIVDWLSTGSNYARWQGDSNEGCTKKALASNVITKIKENGINHRSVKDVIGKIAILQSSYNTAHD